VLAGIFVQMELNCTMFSNKCNLLSSGSVLVCMGLQRQFQDRQPALVSTYSVWLRGEPNEDMPLLRPTSSAACKRRCCTCQSTMQFGQELDWRKNYSSQTIDILPEVKIKVKSRIVTVTGPRGELTRNFKHLQADISIDKSGKKLKVEVWFGTSKHIAAIRTICTHITNLQIGVTKGFEYKMRFVYAHYPVNVNISEDGKTFEVRNFIGQRVVLRTVMLDGVLVERSNNKDEIILRGNDIENVTTSAAQIHQSTKVHNKDIRKFLDGIYVSEGGPIGQN